LIKKWSLGLFAALLMSSAVADVRLVDQRRFADWLVARQTDNSGKLNACLMSTSPKSGVVVGTEQIVISTSVNNLIPNLDKGMMRVMYIVNITGVRDTTNDFTGELAVHLGNGVGGKLIVLLYKTLSTADGAQNLVVSVTPQFLDDLRKHPNMEINRPFRGASDALVFSLNGVSQALDYYEACYAQLSETM
jgi:hypothetical protein